MEFPNPSERQKVHAYIAPGGIQRNSTVATINYGNGQSDRNYFPLDRARWTICRYTAIAMIATW